MKYFLCLGSNLGQKGKNLERALAFLDKEGVNVLRYSSLYETQPVGIKDQPWFYNQVVEVEVDLNALEFLRLINKIERKMGRKPTVKKSPRLIDIDILLAGDSVIKAKELVIPHPRLEKRNFVLVPLKEIAPEKVHPVLKTTIEDLCKNSKDTSLVKRLKCK